jgi:hypothetical protein
MALPLYNEAVPRPHTLQTLADVAEGQWGLFTRRQAEATGMAWTTLSRLAMHGAAERVAHGVYRLRGVPPDDRVALRAAWLQLAPDVPAWERTAERGVVSHRSAAFVHGLGDLPADVHEFTVRDRRQSRRPDVRLHRARLRPDEWLRTGGLIATTPFRTIADLLADGESPDAVAHVVADAFRAGYTDAQALATAIAPHAARLGLRRGDGLAVLEWLADLTGDTDVDAWATEPARRKRASA